MFASVARAGSAIGPLLVGWIVDNFGISYVFTVFEAVALLGGLITIVFTIETTGRVLEEIALPNPTNTHNHKTAAAQARTQN